jgi:hypothetical protein
LITVVAEEKEKPGWLARSFKASCWMRLHRSMARLAAEAASGSVRTSPVAPAHASSSQSKIADHQFRKSESRTGEKCNPGAKVRVQAALSRIVFNRLNIK